ncbi:carbohydrate kinase [Bacteroides gallinaceum]|uniref:carbohydrate kinase family protein n=1 Tax=Bacteroides gallinaceum TaxID=1462571 RepID=UPI0025A3E377|nr:carbohydrate kinase [Bacteroides gallinaceum]MDM8155638.1 carbohydrate kinase [Bacteroides gallinaceum]
MNRKVIGIGETILDILFRDGQPQAAVPGGSVYNAMISLGRMGVDVTFISETGNDRVGQMILDNMRANGVCTENVNVFPDGKSPVSLAFLNEHNDAEYIFYKDYPRQRLDVTMPDIQADDIVMIGSYFAVTPVLRDKVKELLDLARERGAIIYYDVNFRSTHANEAIKLMPTILENFEYADILRGSSEDFRFMFGLDDAEKVYRQKVSFYCNPFIYTDGARDVSLFTRAYANRFPVPKVETVSTIGAGDNFNAGIVYGLIQNHIRRPDIDALGKKDWDDIIACGLAFGSEACRSTANCVSLEFAQTFRR